MKRLTIPLLTTYLLSSVSLANESDIKAIKDHFVGKKISQKNLLPKGFSKSAETTGDLNRDGINDLALLLKKEGSKTLPQYVVILTGEKGDTFNFWKLGANHFVDSNPDFLEKDGVLNFEITKNSLVMTTAISQSMGGWAAGGCTTKWRNGKTGFQLISMVKKKFDRKCACGTSTEINMLTGAAVTKTDQDIGGEPMQKERITGNHNKAKQVFWEDFDYNRVCHDK